MAVIEEDSRHCDLQGWVRGRSLSPADGLDHVGARLLGRTLARMHDAAARFEPPSDFALPHWDADGLFRILGNVLLSRRGKAWHSAVIDFDDCGYGYFFYDLGPVLGTLIEHPTLRRSFIDGYHRIRPIPPSWLRSCL